MGVIATTLPFMELAVLGRAAEKGRPKGGTLSSSKMVVVYADFATDTRPCFCWLLCG